MDTPRFRFASGNLAKLVALPKYALAIPLAWVTPRSGTQWLFGSGIGVGEGALAVAREVRRRSPEARITWLVANEAEAEQASSEGFVAVRRRGAKGFFATLRAGFVVVTHGLGDANRFGLHGARITHLGHGIPLKRLHLDSPVTTAVRGPAPVRRLLHAMYVRAARQVSLYVAGSVTAATRLRSAYRVDPGKVRVLGDPRDDGLIEARTRPEMLDAAHAELVRLLGLEELDDGAAATEPLVLYAPTWRDGEDDPAVPSLAQIFRIEKELKALGARLVIRSHPLGAGLYKAAIGGRIHELSANDVRDVTPLLPGFSVLITDYSSIALDFAVLDRPVIWFAPDLSEYAASRGLYEPLEITAAGQIKKGWGGVLKRLAKVLPSEGTSRRVALAASRALVTRFFAYPEGGAAARVVDEIERLALRDRDRIPEGAIFFESFYGKQVSCNPLALDAEIARRFPETPRYWSVTSELQQVPQGSTPLLVGGQDWFAARARARLLIVNDWLRYHFRRRKRQFVLQTWHGTMLKHLALGRDNVSRRTKLAIRRESRRWNLLLSQNPHSTEQFRSSYAYEGEVLEVGYPRDDRLANAVFDDARSEVVREIAVRALGLDSEQSAKWIMVYAPTWREHAATPDEHSLDVVTLADALGEEWLVLVRGHTRSESLGLHTHPRVIDVSDHADVNDVILAADLFITDYSSLMFDVSVARVPLVFYVPDLEEYLETERGFTFDFEAAAPAPLVRDAELLVEFARVIEDDGDRAPWVLHYAEAARAWRERFNPHDDGGAAARVVDALVERGVLAEPVYERAENLA